MEQKIKIYAAVMTSLFVLSAATGAYFWRASSDQEAMNVDLSNEKVTLLMEKGQLSAQLENLQMVYEETIAENSHLRGTVSQKEQMLSEKDSQLKKMKKQASSDRITLEDLRKEVLEMRNAKQNLETEISMLKSENLALRNENDQLTQNLQIVKKENAALANRINDLAVVAHHVKLPGGLRTSAFRVEVEKRNDKLTVKGKKARELVISFDMMDVPTAFQGVQNVYLAVTDNKGTPVMAKNSAPVKIGEDDNITEVVIHQTKEINIGQGQRLAFNYPLDDRLKPGTYRASIYTKNGWIGSASFRVS